MRRSNRTGGCLTIICLAISLTASSTTHADDADSKQPADTNGVETDSQAEPTAAAAKQSEVDPVELAKSVTNEDIEWDISGFFPALHAMLSDRAKKLEFGQGWSPRQSWEIRYAWLAGMEDPNRDEICHYLLTSVYDQDHTIGKKYSSLFEWSDVRATWNGRVLFRTEHMQPTIEAERQMLVAAWKRRIIDWEDEQFQKDRDGPAIQEAIEVFVTKIDSNPVAPRVLKHARTIESILDRRKDLNVKPVTTLVPVIDPAARPAGFRILKAAYLAGNIKEQIRKGHGEDCPLAGVRTMLAAYDDLQFLELIDQSEVLDQWLSWFFTEQDSKLEKAVDLIVIRANIPPPPPKPISKNE